MLSTDVWPALVTTYGALVTVPPTAAMLGAVNGVPMAAVALKGLSEGEQLSVPESPWAWLLNSTGKVGDYGSDKVKTDMHFTLRLFYDWESDPTNAERILMPIIEQVRAVHQFHLKLQTATIVNSMVRGWDWGYIPVNAIWYRTCDIDIEVSEKELRVAQA